MSFIDISVIMCTHNRAFLLPDVLNSLEKTEPPENTEIELVIVDNACSDNTFQTIEEYAQNSKFKTIPLKEPKKGKTFALNTAINIAKGNLLAFVDDDHLISPGYFKAIHSALENYPDFNLFCGRIMPNWDGTEPAWVHDDINYPIRPFPIPNFNMGDHVLEVQLDKGMFIPGAGNLVIKESVFEDIGLFSEGFGPKGHNLRGGEDLEFVRRALKQGERLIYIPEILQYHQVDKKKLTLNYVIKKAYYRSMAAYQLNKKISSAPIPWYFYRLAATHLLKSIFCLHQAARRYYLVKLATVIGEIQGHRKGSLE